MEEENKIKKNLTNKLLLAGVSLIGILAINNGAKIDQIKEVTSTYQGHSEDDGRTYLVFDNKIKEAREDFPDLVIQGKPDTLEIGKKYAIKYSIKNWKNTFPNKIKEIKYAQ